MFLQKPLGQRNVRRRTNILVVSALAISSMTLCTSVRAQETNVTQKMPQALSDKTVSIDAEDATLASVITTLMQSVGANYTLDNSLKTIQVTAHLHNLRLDTALNVLLRSVTPPLTYRFEDGVYSFIPKVEPIVPPLDPRDGTPEPSLPGVRHIQIARVDFIDAAEVARILGGIPIRTSDGQTYGLVDPNKLGIINAPSTPAPGNNGMPPTNGSGGPGGPNVPGAGGQNSTLPVNLFDYLWLVNRGAGY